MKDSLSLMTNLEYLSQYLEYIKFEKRLAQLTVNNYQRDIKELLKKINKDLSFFQHEDIRGAVAQMHAHGLSGTSISRRLSAWRGFFDFLNSRYAFKQNPVISIKAPKDSKKLPQTLTVDQTIKLVDIKDKTFLGKRDHAILELFYSSGLRLSELTNLKIEDISFSEANVRVTGKGNKSRIVPIGKNALHAMHEWLKMRQTIVKLDSKNNGIFLNKQGNPISARAIQYRLKFWAIKQGIPENIHPHLLRHSFASHVLQSSQDLRAVQELLGHSNISTTQIYTHLDFQHLAKIYDKSHPRAKKK